MKFRRVGRYGPRCSTRAKDHYGEMLADDYRPDLAHNAMLPYEFWRQWRESELAWMRGDTPNPYRKLAGLM